MPSMKSKTGQESTPSPMKHVFFDVSNQAQEGISKRLEAYVYDIVASYSSRQQIGIQKF